MPDNVDLVGAICSRWARGDWSAVEWADPEIEFVIADGPDPRTVTGIARMAQTWREFLATFSDYATTPEELEELDGGRVLVKLTATGRGKASGADLATNYGATVFDLRDGAVTRLAVYFDRRNALRDLGLEP
jgi:ketosteroid isomerase-like protein